MDIILANNFDVDVYKLLNKDLQHLDNNKLIQHFIRYGYNENRIYKLPYDFSFYSYYILNKDLYNLNFNQLKEHYLKHGINENRKYNILYDNINTKINYIDAIVWINLERSIDRNKYMTNLLGKLYIKNYKIDAIDGEKINTINIQNLNNKYNLKNNEIACTLSHIKAINKCSSINGNYFLICEDDIAFDNIYFFKKDLKQIIQEAPEFDILLLYKTYDKTIKERYAKWSDYLNINDESDIISGAVSYIITKKTIENIKNIIYYEYLNNTDYYRFINNNIIDVSEKFIFKNFNTYVYKYNFINTLINNSLIHKEHLEYHFNSSINEYKLILNDINII